MFYVNTGEVKYLTVQSYTKFLGAVTARAFGPAPGQTQNVCQGPVQMGTQDWFKLQKELYAFFMSFCDGVGWLPPVLGCSGGRVYGHSRALLLGEVDFRPFWEWPMIGCLIMT